MQKRRSRTSNWRQHRLGSDASTSENEKRTAEDRDKRNFDESRNWKRCCQTKTSGTVTSGRTTRAGARVPSTRCQTFQVKLTKACPRRSPVCSKSSPTAARARTRSVRSRTRVHVPRAGATKFEAEPAKTEIPSIAACHADPAERASSREAASGRAEIVGRLDDAELKRDSEFLSEQ